jgi:hypothetical protein
MFDGQSTVEEEEPMNSVALEQLLTGTQLPADEATCLHIQPGSGSATRREPLDHLTEEIVVTTSGEWLRPPEWLIDWWLQAKAYKHSRQRIPAFLVADSFAEGRGPCDFCERECEYELN